VSGPNFFILGTTKGGTSTLHLWLRQHPDVELAEPKELHYFCQCPNPKLRVAESIDEYLQHFSSTAPVRGEASPCYLYDRSTIQAISRRFPEARYLVSLRDPVDRFWSHYLMNEVYRPTGLQPEAVLESNLERGPCDALNDLFGMGLYGSQLRDAYDLLGRDRVHVTFLERLGSDPEGEVERILNFLGLRHEPIDVSVRDKLYVEPRGPLGRLFLRNRLARRLGVAVLPAPARRFLRTQVLGDPAGKPTAPEGLVERLRELYTADSRLLEELLGESVPWSWHKAEQEKSSKT
jgi:hypothetical protein